MEYQRQSILSLKDKIKVLALEQRELRNQKKSVHIQGERKLDPNIAAGRHFSNSNQLSHMYIAYAIMRGKAPQPFKRKIMNNYLLTKILEEYGTPLRA